MPANQQPCRWHCGAPVTDYPAIGLCNECQYKAMWGADAPPPPPSKTANLSARDLMRARRVAAKQAASS